MPLKINKIYSILILMIFISKALSHLDTNPVSSPILTDFYKDTNIILKYQCSEGKRSFVLIAVTLDCEPQDFYQIPDFEQCFPGQYMFKSTIQISCTNSTIVLNTDSDFQACLNSTTDIKKDATLKSRRSIPSNSNSTEPPTPMAHPTTHPTTTEASTTSTLAPIATTPDQTVKKFYTMKAPLKSVYLIWLEGQEEGTDKDEWSVDYHTSHGYLLPTDWPLLIFYQLSLSLYVFFLAVWLVLCCVYRKDLLQVQYYIGFVIFLGLVEKVIFVSEYESLNRTGIKDNYGAVVFGELVSALKRTAARILVVVVSVGFGIVIPRLGRTLYYLLAIALIYFPFACIDGVYTRKQSAVLRRGWMLVVGLVLVVVDTFICYWIFSALINVMRKLSLRRNAVKLRVYRHFTNTLIFTMFAAVAYLVWFVITFQRSACNKSWQDRWVDFAFWPFLFQLILLLIIVLWRPSPTNDRYSYSPLVDEVDDDEAQEPMINDAHEGVKNRNKPENASKPDPTEDTLKWVDENIPKSVHTALPKMLDSEDEMENTLFEINKMQ